MGEHDACPRCKAKLRYIPAGYAGATVVDGGVAPVPAHVRCIMCGYYEDIKPKAAPISQELKNQLKPAPPNKVVNGSEVIGLIKEVVRNNYKFIVKERNDGAGWPEITIRLQAQHPEVALTFQAVRNAWWRIENSKRAAATRKGVRKAGLAV